MHPAIVKFRHPINLKRWFEEEPWRTGRELLKKLQVEQSGAYPDALLQTVLRRLKVWLQRSEQARALVFTGSSITLAATHGVAAPAEVVS